MECGLYQGLWPQLLEMGKDRLRETEGMQNSLKTQRSHDKVRGHEKQPSRAFAPRTFQNSLQSMDQEHHGHAEGHLKGGRGGGGSFRMSTLRWGTFYYCVL